MKLEAWQTTSKAQIHLRVLNLLAQDETRVYTSSECAAAAWPGHKMKPQASALAVGKFLLELRGFNWIWRCTGRRQGWRISTAGLEMHRKCHATRLPAKRTADSGVISEQTDK